MTYLPMMKQAVKEGKAQLWSPKTMRLELLPIEDERNVNKRRAEIGMEPLEDYVRPLGIDYHLPK